MIVLVRWGMRSSRLGFSGLSEDSEGRGVHRPGTHQLELAKGPGWSDSDIRVA